MGQCVSLPQDKLVRAHWHKIAVTHDQGSVGWQAGLGSAGMTLLLTAVLWATLLHAVFSQGPRLPMQEDK